MTLTWRWALTRENTVFTTELVDHALSPGFQLCARFTQFSRHRIREYTHTVVSFDRGCITSCSCSCDAHSPWCSHAVAVCLAHIRGTSQAKARPTLSTSLVQMDALQLRKLVQFRLIADLPGQSLLAAQELVDELLQPRSLGSTRRQEHQVSWCVSHLRLVYIM